MVFVHFPAGISKGIERQDKARQRSRLGERVGSKQDISEIKSRCICRELLLLILVLWKFMLRLRRGDAFSLHPLQCAVIPTVAPCCSFQPCLGTDTQAVFWKKGGHFGRYALSTKPSLNYKMIFLYCVCMQAGF